MQALPWFYFLLEVKSRQYLQKFLGLRYYNKLVGNKIYVI